MTIQQEVKSLQDALKTLEQAQQLFNQYKEMFLDRESEEYREICIGMRDCMIGRFVCCVDLCGLLLMTYIRNTESSDFEPRSVSLNDMVKYAVNANIFSARDGDLFIEMVANRDKRMHTYDEPFVEEMVLNMPEYVRVFHVVIDRLKI
jgi:hypothetical protein